MMTNYYFCTLSLSQFLQYLTLSPYFLDLLFFYSPFCSDFHFIIPFLFFSFLLFSCLPLIFFFSPLFSSFSLLFFCSGDLMLRFLMECQARRTFLSQLVQPVLLIIPTYQIPRIPIQQIKWILVRECN